MRRLSTFIVGMIVGGILIYGGLSYHIVHAKDGMHLVPKLQSTFANTYVDIRGYGAKEWLEHFEIAQALQAAGHADLIEAAAGDALETSLGRMLGQPDSKR